MDIAFPSLVELPKINRVDSTSIMDIEETITNTGNAIPVICMPAGKKTPRIIWYHDVDALLVCKIRRKIRSILSTLAARDCQVRGKCAPHPGQEFMGPIKIIGAGGILVHHHIVDESEAYHFFFTDLDVCARLVQWDYHRGAAVFERTLLRTMPLWLFLLDCISAGKEITVR